MKNYILPILSLMLMLTSFSVNAQTTVPDKGTVMLFMDTTKTAAGDNSITVDYTFTYEGDSIIILTLDAAVGSPTRWYTAPGKNSKIRNIAPTSLSKALFRIDGVYQVKIATKAMGVNIGKDSDEDVEVIKQGMLDAASKYTTTAPLISWNRDAASN